MNIFVFSFFYINEFENNDIYFNIIEHLVIEEENVNKSEIIEKIRMCFKEVRLSTFYSSDETYKYFDRLDRKEEVSTYERYNQNYILEIFLKENFNLDIDIDDSSILKSISFSPINEEFKYKRRCRIEIDLNTIFIFQNPNLMTRSIEKNIIENIRLITQELIQYLIYIDLINILEKETINLLEETKKEVYTYLVVKHLRKMDIKGISKFYRLTLEKEYKLLSVGRRNEMAQTIGYLLGGIINANKD